VVSISSTPAIARGDGSRAHSRTEPKRVVSRAWQGRRNSDQAFVPRAAIRFWGTREPRGRALRGGGVPGPGDRLRFEIRRMTTVMASVGAAATSTRPPLFWMRPALSALLGIEVTLFAAAGCKSQVAVVEGLGGSSLGGGPTTTTTSTTGGTGGEACDVAAWVQAAVGDFNTCARKADGSAWCWGDNTGGQLGDGTTVAKLSPVQVTALGPPSPRFRSVSVTPVHARPMAHSGAGATMNLGSSEAERRTTRCCPYR